MSCCTRLAQVKQILRTLAQSWAESASHCEDAAKCAELLTRAMEKGEVAPTMKDSDLQSCSPPQGLCMEGTYNLENDLVQSLFASWNYLRWEEPKQMHCPGSDMEGAVKVSPLIGPDGPLLSDEISINIFYVAPNTTVPRHSDHSTELLQILEGRGTHIGPAVGQWIEMKHFLNFPPTVPKLIQTGPENPFLAISVCHGDITGGLWLNESKEIGKKYLEIANLKIGVEEYYDGFAEKYEEAMRHWGYCLPELLSNFVIQQGNVHPDRDCKVIDLGCGDGAVGVAMKEKGFTDLTGVDFSNAMLKLAMKKGCYSAIQKADLLKPLPFEDETFDCLVTSAVTTYLDPTVLENWIRVMKTGALLCIVHKAAVWPKWEGEQKRLEDEKRWEHVWISEEVPYLPSLEVQGVDKAKIYMYKKI